MSDEWNEPADVDAVCWFAEYREWNRDWCPTLQTANEWRQLPPGFNTREECEAFIVTIPAGKDGGA